MLKLCAEFISAPLSYILNLSFLEGCFPKKLKIAVVKPLFKKGDDKDINNYRPITIIPILSKVFERVIYNRLNKFIDKYNILTTQQFGFRKNRSTTLACYNLVKEVTECIDNKMPVAALLLDLSKAFDLIDHGLLLAKIEKYGLRGTAHDWLHSYLSDRSQCTQITRMTSDENSKTIFKKQFQSKYRINNRGVPQGSILGPLLFLLFINDLPSVTHHKCLLFADDTTLIMKCTNPELYEYEINCAINEIVTWLNENRLMININKTKLIQFRNYKMNPITLDIKYQLSKVEKVESALFLGIMIDQHLSWKQHINLVCNKLNRFVYALKRVRKTVSQRASLAAYHGYVSSVLLYGLPLWGNSVDLLKAFKVQKKCIRAVCGAWFLDTCKPLFLKTKVLPLPCMYIREICVFVKQYPNYFIRHEELLARHTRHKNRIYLPKHHSTFHSKNAFCMAVKIFNKLPDEFKELPLSLFKRRLSKWLLLNCFYSTDEYFSYK